MEKTANSVFRYQPTTLANAIPQWRQGQVQGGAAEPTDPLTVPFADQSSRFWEKTTAFWVVNLLGLTGASILAYDGLTQAGPLLACGLACGLTAGMAAADAMAGEGVPNRPLRCMASAAAVALVLALFLVEVGRQVFFMPSRGESILIALFSYVCAWCITSYIASIFAVKRSMQDGESAWNAMGRRFAGNWHRAIGLAVLMCSCVAASVPVAMAVAVAPSAAEARIASLTRNPSWLWLAPLGNVATMVTQITGRIHPVASDAYGAFFMSIMRRVEVFLVTFGLVCLGVCYALLLSAAHIMTRLGACRPAGAEA